jgi:hypothetical protein
VVDGPIAGDNGAWAHAVAEELGARALVDATRKTADVARHLCGLGIVDVIAVHGTAATSDPASVQSAPDPPRRPGSGARLAVPQDSPGIR